MDVLTPRQQGDIGECSALEWLASRGWLVSIPFGHSPDYDLVADTGDRLLRVQVKTSTCFYKNRFSVSICTRGGNQSWSGMVKRFSAARCDYLFVLVADGRRWFIPASEVGGSGLLLGGPKYAPFEIERGRPIASEAAAGSLDSPRPAGFPSGQRGRTVNSLAQPSQVRILPPP